MTERQQGMHAALTVLASRCERLIDLGKESSAGRGESHEVTQMYRVATHALRKVAEDIRVEAMLPPDAVPAVLRADYQPPSAKMDAAKVAPEVQP